MRAWLSVLTTLGLCGSTYSQGVPVIFPWVPVNDDTLPSLETSAAASDHDDNSLTVIAAWNTLVGPDSQADQRIGYAVSFDGFATPQWTVALLPAPIGLRQFDPMTAFDKRTGNLWVGGITGTPASSCQSDADCPPGETCVLFQGIGFCTTSAKGVYVARLDPITGILQPSVMAYTGAADKAWMAAGPKYGEPGTTRLYVAFSGGLIWSDQLGDAGTWSFPPVSLDGIVPLPRIGPNGELYVVTKAGGDLQIEVRRSLDSGANFTSLAVASRNQLNVDDMVAGTFIVPTFTYLAVDPIVGTLYVVHHDISNPTPGGNDNVDIFFTKSDDMGKSWTTPVVINFDSSPPGDQFFPWIEVDGFGRIHILFFDTRNMQPQDDSLEVALIDAYYMFSDDGGSNWTEFRLSEQPWESDHDGTPPQQPKSIDFIGDYLGMAVAGNRVYPMYPNDASKPPNTPPGDPDIYTNVICHCLGDCGNCDEVVGIVDFLDLLSQWGQPAPQRCDLDADGIVGINDFLDLLIEWGPCDQPPGSAMAVPPTLEKERADSCLDPADESL